MRRGVVSAALLWLCSSALGEPLPDPLTLEQALALGSAGHPIMDAQYAQLGLAEAQRDEVSSQLGLDARFIADGRWVEPSTNDNVNDADANDSRYTSHNDSRLHLVVTKRLYDFGQSDAKIAAANALAEVEALRLETLRGRHRLEVARSFLEVVLADLASAEAEEAMAIEYVRLDRLRQRNELKQASDVEVAKQDYRYQSRRVKRYEAQARQRTTRARLAEMLDRPGELPYNVIAPELQDLDKEVPELSKWIDQALVANPTLKALRAEAEAAREQMRAARYGNRPVLTGELQASDYEREFATRDQYRAALALEVPLYSGGRLDARRAAAIASAQRVDAELAQAQSEVRQALVEAREHIGVLQVRREQAAAEMDYRDLNLDHARTLYELEARADLGNNMADFSGSRLRLARATYQLALTWTEVALLTGHAEWDPLAADAQAPSADAGAASP